MNIWKAEKYVWCVCMYIHKHIYELVVIAYMYVKVSSYTIYIHSCICIFIYTV